MSFVLIIGVDVITGSVMKKITKEADGTMTVHTENGKVPYCIICNHHKAIFQTKSATYQ